MSCLSLPFAVWVLSCGRSFKVEPSEIKKAIDSLIEVRALRSFI